MEGPTIKWQVHSKNQQFESSWDEKKNEFTIQVGDKSAADSFCEDCTKQQEMGISFLFSVIATSTKINC